MERNREISIYVFKSGMWQGVNIESVPKSYIKWFIESKSFKYVKKSDKLAIIDYYRVLEGLDKVQMLEKVDNSSEWHSISEFPIFDSEVEVKPFTAILTFKGEYFVDSKGRSVSLELVDEWRYTDKYLQK